MPMAAHTLPPPLRDGESLSSREFLRRWEAMPDLKHAELIEGIVFMPSPVHRPHSRFHFILSSWLGSYERATPGCEGGSEGSWLMGSHNVPQPDLTLRILPGRGGQSRDEGEYTAGAPELLVEVAASSQARDLGVKWKLYERKGVQEYLIALAGKRQVSWNLWTPGGFRPFDPAADGIFRSQCFPGLWLDPEALYNQDLPRLFAALDRGLATEEHAAFVERLAGPGR
jgi:Uma2 family endonuclease